jgi:two-component system LytT family response regulator
VLEQLGSEMPSTLIFVTAHNEYALRAFEAGALDYLLKPFDDARFQRALGRAKEKIALYASRQRQPLDRLVVKSPGRVLFLHVADIDWIEAADYYACIHVGESSHLIRRTLAELEGDVGDQRFFRTHRSVIVNLERIRGLELQSNGEYAVVLIGGTQLRLSRRYRKALQDRLGV